MNRYLKFIAGLFIVLIFTSGGCKNESTYDPDLLLLLKCWGNASEEKDQEGIMIFRPCATHTFPPARYRQYFTFKENDTIEYSVLAPNDAHYTLTGKWEYDANSNQLTIWKTEGGTVGVFEVVELGEDVLKVKE